MLRLMDISNRKKASVKGKTHAKSSACISTASPCERPGAGFASTYSTTVGTGTDEYGRGISGRKGVGEGGGNGSRSGARAASIL